MLAACTYAAVAQNAGTPANNKTFFVAKPGTLVSMLTEDEANSVTHLTLTGKLNAIDFKHLRDEFKNLKVLDISNASISTYAGKSGTYPDRFYIYPPNCVPAYAFCQQTSDSTFKSNSPENYSFRENQEHRRRGLQGLRKSENMPVEKEDCSQPVTGRFGG